MTSLIQPNHNIKINMRSTVKYQQQIKDNRWNGYQIKILKDSEDALQQLQEVMEKRRYEKDLSTYNTFRYSA